MIAMGDSSSAETCDRFLRWIDNRAYEMIETVDKDVRLEARDQVFVSLLAYFGIHGAEVLRMSADERTELLSSPGRTLGSAASAGTTRTSLTATVTDAIELPQSGSSPSSVSVMSSPRNSYSRHS